MTEVAETMRANVPNIELPKLPIVNKAQAGGDKISMVVQLLAGGSGLVKSGLGMLGTVGKVGKAVETAGTVAKAAEAAGALEKTAGSAGALGKSAEAAGTVKAAANAGKTAEAAVHGVSDAAKVAEAAPGVGGAVQAAEAGAQSAGAGVKILKRVKKLREQYLGRTPGKNSKTGKEVQERMRAEGKLREVRGKTAVVKLFRTLP